MIRVRWSAWTILALLAWPIRPAVAEIDLKTADVAAVKAAGGAVIGQFPSASEEGDNAMRLGTAACLQFPTAPHFDVHQGTISFRVKPFWDGDDHLDHAFFHLGDGNAHVTVFKTADGSVRFVYKASPSQYSACNVEVSSWKSGQWHEIQAAWATCYRGDLLLLLSVDGQRASQGGGAVLKELPGALFLGRRGRAAQPAEAILQAFRLSGELPELPYATGPKDPVAVTVDAGSGRPFRRVHDFTTLWNNRQNPLPFVVGDPTYRRFVDAGFRMIRLVAFSESWLWGTRVERDQAGNLLTDFKDFDRLLDLFSAAGAEPYIRLAYHTPSALTDPKLTGPERRYALPDDLQQWDELMERIVRHVRVERKLPVRYWVAALNEGDIPVRQGEAEPETIWRLYERTARLVKRLDPQAKVGGPALAWSVEAEGKPAPMFVDFIDYCKDRDLPLDFICFHGYRKAHPRDYESLTETIRRTVESRWPEKAGKLEYFLDEWNLWHRDGSQDDEYGASYLAAALHYQRRAKLTKSSIVSFNHFQIPGAPGWRGGEFVYNDRSIAQLSGLPLIKGPVVTAPYFVWLMHNRLGDRELALDLPGRDGVLEDDSGGLTATLGDGKISLLFWHFDLMRSDARRWTVRLENLPEAMRKSKTLRLTEYRIDHDHTNPYTDYVIHGKDSHHGRYNLESAQLEAIRSETIPAAGPAITLPIELPNMSVTLLELEPAAE
jgi:hypothetical protein